VEETRAADEILGTDPRTSRIVAVCQGPMLATFFHRWRGEEGALYGQGGPRDGQDQRADLADRGAVETEMTGMSG